MTKRARRNREYLKNIGMGLPRPAPLKIPVRTDLRPGWMDPSDSYQFACEEFEVMRAHIESGGRVIVGTDEFFPSGSVMIRITDVGEAVIKRRATRDEFVTCLPGNVNKSKLGRAPFYFEVEIRLHGKAIMAVLV